MRGFAICLSFCLPLCLSLICANGVAYAQQAVATMPIADAKVSGAVEVQGQRMRLSSGASVAAGATAVALDLASGGTLKVCANSAVHLAASENAGEMTYSLDHGAMELHAKIGAASDVVVTPDLRLLVSGPAVANVSVRVNQQGDTCVDNAMPNAQTNPLDQAPYVTATEQLGEGVYRVQAGQRVTMEHGSVAQVVDNEKEPCGCPPVPRQADPQAFPLAQSEGLAPATAAATAPIVPAGTVHAQVTVPFMFDANHPQQPPPPASEATAEAPAKPTAHAAEQPNLGGDLVTAVRRLWRRLFNRRS